MPVRVERLDHLVLNVRDVEASAAWYARVLAMERTDFAPGNGQPNRTALTFGNQKLNLRPVGTDPAAWFTAAQPVAGSEDLCFITTADPADVVAHLGDCGVEVETGPVPKQGALGPMTSVYCRDPDGNLIEIATYPRG
ncbi:MAG: VOC family protein [Candidatus Eremiobacteraeota bacterium]|nr:VOC family protein [Candidatus Eremiobacteraeota bacterium]MBV9409642.1 VOC family protein [Candidatus Eremiobacteraeota bacterium]